ncbi:MAG TPA: pyridoxal-dependent decarboxylase [Steroidobacter sp.]|uniref:pyridoxal phosphate-dependent decarboxylase family protein n=1 Tax=Steroidobacter sp. TaxID=1978227 RepID=UPI002ED77161
MADPLLYPCFLGPYAENDNILEKLVVEFLRDHVYWRRNFHPEDPPAIPTSAALQPEFQAFEARLRRELHSLSAALKRSVPFHSPRFLGHMVSDLLLPGLIAQILTLPYNPNNVNDDAAPVTVDLEIQVGLQLARLVGYPHDIAQPACAFGHLTSGGTLANVQALRLALAMKAFPVALRAIRPPDFELPDDDWTAFGLSTDAVCSLLWRWEQWLAEQPTRDQHAWRLALSRERLETLGHHAFFTRHPQLRPPLLLAPASAHYSWPKAMKLVGLGVDQYVTIAQHDLHLDLGALEETLARAHARREPVLAAVAILGTTEFGGVDPIDGLVAARDRYAAAGSGFSVHVDAAWGGYLATVFRNPDGTLRSQQDVAGDFKHFPSSRVHGAIAALGRTDSITIDPHKLGYISYGAGAFVCRDHRPMSLLASDADYVFTEAASTDYMRRYRQLGRYVPEGSKPGAMAAAVYVTHRVLPLDHAHFGRLPAQSLRGAEAFVERAQQFIVECADRVHACLPFMPDSNLVCLALNPAGSSDLETANAFVRRIYDELHIDPHAPLQTREFFGSTTTLRLDRLRPETLQRALDALHLAKPSDLAATPLLVLRHTIMNPFVLDTQNDINYIDRYFEYLSRRIRSLTPL